MRNKFCAASILLAVLGFMAGAATVQFNYNGTSSLGTLPATGTGSFVFSDSLLVQGAINQIGLGNLNTFSFQATTSPKDGGAGSTYDFGLNDLQSLTFYVDLTSNSALSFGPLITSTAVSGTPSGAGTAALNFTGGNGPLNYINFSNGQKSVGTIAIASFTADTPEPATALLLALAGVVCAFILRGKVAQAQTGRTL